MRKFAVLLTVATLVIGCAGALHAAASIYGISGLIETPDDSITSSKMVTPVANRIFDLKINGVAQKMDISTYGGAIGIIPNLEVSGVAVDVDQNGVSTEGLVNAKYRLLTETADKPSVTVGALDLGKRLDHMSDGEISDISAFVVVSKNISSLAEGVSGTVTKPIKGTLGVGSGLYKGLFAGLDMSLAPKLSLAVEYLGTGIRNDTTFNGMVRFNPTESLSINAGAMGFKDFFAGASFNVSTF